MRPIALFLAAALIAIPVVVATETSSNAQTFGKADCGPKFSCSAYSGIESSDPKILSLIAQANNCVVGNFGLGAQGGNFRDEMGLDSSQCLTPQPKQRTAVGAALVPHCCIVPRDGDNCVLHCDLITK